MSLAYFPFYPADYEAKTSHLTLEEDGAYNRLLRLCWVTPGCSIPDDRAWIMRRLRVTEETYDRVVSVVLAEFFKRRRNRLYQPKLSRVFEETSAAHNRRAKAGAKGGRPPKALKGNETEETKAIAMLKQPEPEPEPDKERKKEGGGDGSAGARETAISDQPPTDREFILDAIGVDPVSGLTGHGGKMLGTQVDMERAKRWAALGLTLPDIVAVIRETMAQKTDGPPKSFAYFDGPMERYAGAKSAPAMHARAGPDQFVRSAFAVPKPNLAAILASNPELDR